MAKAKKPRPGQDQNQQMRPIHAHAAAVDIGATLHVAAVGPGRAPEPVRSFGTFTADLHRLADWFAQCGVRTVAMESTGVFWIPAFEVLEQRGFEVVLVNPRDAKHVPGRKTDVSDAQWLQRLHEYCLLRGSFRPQSGHASFRTGFRHRRRWRSDHVKVKSIRTRLSPGDLMQTVNIHAAKTHLSRLVDQAAAGEEIVIARSGRPVAKLVPLATPVTGSRRRLGILAGKLPVPADFDAPLPETVLAAFEGR